MDSDGDGAGDVCDPFPFDADDDADGDGISGHVDNCPATANPDQKDTDSDSLGDACDNTLNGDTDGDGIDNLKDNCPTTANPGQEDSDGDGEGNACDTTPNGDTDKDGVDNAADNCPSVSGPSANGGCPWPSPATRTGGITATGAGVANQALVPVTGAQFTELSCNEPSTTLSMAGFQVAFTSLCGYSAALNGLEEAVLPGALPQGYAFTAGIDLTLSNNNNSVSTLPVGSSISLAYELPSGNSGDTLTILYWDPGANGGLGDWIEQDVTITDGKIVLTVETPGIFVIVQDTTSGQGPSQEYAAEDEFSSLLLAWFRKIALALSFN